MKQRTWLSFEDIEHPIFQDTEAIAKRFEKWATCIFLPNKYDEDSFLRTYRGVLEKHHLEITEPPRRESEPIHVKIYEDLIRTFGCQRRQFHLETHAAPEEFAIYAAMIRIVLFLEKHNPSFKYRQSIIDLSVPVYHVAWCYLTRVKSVTDTTLIESVAAFMIESLLEGSNHINSIPGIQSYDNDDTTRKLNEIFRGADDVHKFLITKKVETGSFCVLKWYLLAFTQQFDFPDVLTLWDFFLSKTIRDFDSQISSMCVASLQRLFPKIKRLENRDDITVILQNLKEHVSVSELVPQ